MQTDVWYSPDGGGWFLQQEEGTRTRVSLDVYATRTAAVTAFKEGRIRWGFWH